MRGTGRAKSVVWRWQERFIAALKQAPHVALACKAAGISRETAYKHRRDNPLFAAEWEAVLQESVDDLEEKAFQEPANAYEEARRGAYNPTYLYYTLGKLQIYKLRDDYQKARGSSYSLQGFHDQFVRQGSIPIKLIRRILLPGDNGSTL